jgi:hypothetical protein
MICIRKIKTAPAIKAFVVDYKDAVVDRKGGSSE